CPCWPVSPISIGDETLGGRPLPAAGEAAAAARRTRERRRELARPDLEARADDRHRVAGELHPVRHGADAPRATPATLQRDGGGVGAVEEATARTAIPPKPLGRARRVDQDTRAVAQD